MKTKIKNNPYPFAAGLAILLAALVLQFTEVTSGATDTDQITLEVTVNQTIALDCGADPVDLGALDPGTPVYASTTCTTTTNALAGYDLQVKRDDADTTLDLTTDAATNITDLTAWDPTAGGGNGNANLWVAQTSLGFGVYASTATKNTTWWGNGAACDAAGNKYAGFPAAYATIMDHDAYSGSSTTTGICYKLDVPTTQIAGDYDGTITYQASSKP